MIHVEGKKFVRKPTTGVDGKVEKEKPGTITGKKGVVFTSPDKEKERQKLDKEMADYLRGVIISGHAYWGDPKSYGKERTVEGAEHGEYGAGHPDIGYMPELSQFAGREYKGQRVASPTSVMQAMEFGVQQARERELPLVFGSYCDQWGCVGDERVAPITRENLLGRSKSQNYQAIVDTTKGLSDDFLMAVPLTRTVDMSSKNPFGFLEGIVGYRPNKPPLIIKKNKPTDVRLLIKELQDANQ